MSLLLERRIAGSYLRGFQVGAILMAGSLLGLFGWRLLAPLGRAGRLGLWELPLASAAFSAVALFTRAAPRLPAARMKAAWMLAAVGLGHCAWVQVAFGTDIKTVNFMLALTGLGLVLPETPQFALATVLCLGTWAATLGRVPLQQPEPWVVAWVTAGFIAWSIHFFVKRLLTEHQRLSLRDRRLIREKSRLLEALRDSEQKVERLGGLIPICAACKKVRNDEGYWEQVEAFIEANTGTGLTHGYCPVCYEAARRELDALMAETPVTASGAPGALRS